MTEIHDYLRILFARLGQALLPEVRHAIGTQTADEIVEKILHLPEGSKVLGDGTRSRGAMARNTTALWEELRGSGFNRVRIDGKTRLSLDATPDAEPSPQAQGSRSSIDRAVVRQVDPVEARRLD